jgi:hypothetical protein
MSFSTEPHTTGPDPYFAHMEAVQQADKASFDARMAAKYPVVQVKSGIEVSGRPVRPAVLHGIVRQWSDDVATHEHCDARVTENVR